MLLLWGISPFQDALRCKFHRGKKQVDTLLCPILHDPSNFSRRVFLKKRLESGEPLKINNPTWSSSLLFRVAGHFTLFQFTLSHSTLRTVQGIEGEVNVVKWVEVNQAKASVSAHPNF